jgi:threonine dehydrogenase-like Zn-dependent dehydrogenase
MKRRNVVVTGPGRVILADEDLPALTPGKALLETVATGLSTGTELAFVKGDHTEAHLRYDRELGLFRPPGPGASDPGPGDEPAGSIYPVRRLGYMEVARVTESATRAVPEGVLVAAAYGHASAHVADPVTEHLVPLPEGLDPLLGVLVAHMGPICANGLLHAAGSGHVPQGLGDGVNGRRVAVVGGGMVGLLVGLLCVHHGAADVVVVDEDATRRTTAEALGLESWDPGPADDPAAALDAAAALKTRWRHGPGDHGADVVFQCRGRTRALATALRIARPQSSVVDLAFYTEPAAGVHLGTEFHHNGLSLVCAQIGRTPRGTAPWWDRHRLSLATVDLLQSRGDDVRRHLLNQETPFARAPDVLVGLAAGRGNGVGIVFTT